MESLRSKEKAVELSTEVQQLEELYKAGTRGHPQERQAGRKEQTSTGRDDEETLEPGKGSCAVALRRRPAANVETATELECTPRSTGSSSLVSAAAGSESSTASHTMLANQVPPLAAFSGEEKDGITFGDWNSDHPSLSGCWSTLWNTTQLHMDLSK